jgi:hypothetical protein
LATSTAGPPHVVGEGRVDQPVHHMGAVDHRLRHARRRGQQRHQQGPQALVVAQQREELHAGGQAREEVVEARQASSALPVAASGLEQRRQQFGEVGAGRRGAGRGIAAIVPFAHRGETLAGSLKPMALSVSMVPGSSSLPVKTRLPCAAPKRLALGEEVGIVARPRA